MSFLITAAALALAVQSAKPAPSPVVFTDLSQIPVEEAAAPRCGIVFAFVDGAQKVGDPRAKDWPKIEKTNGKEFFVRAMAKLMEDRNLTRDQISVIVSNEINRLAADDFVIVNQLKQPCMMMKKAAGL